MRQNRPISVAFVASGARWFYRIRDAPATCGTRPPSGAGWRPGPPGPARAIHRRSPVRPGPGCPGIGSPSAAWVKPILEAKGVPARFAEEEEQAIYGGVVAPFPLVESVTAQHSGKRSPKVARKLLTLNRNFVSPQIGSLWLGQLTRLPSTRRASASISGREPSSLRIGSAEYCAT